MASEVVFLLGLALALGLKHSYDADHVVAVSNLLTRSESLRKTSLMSLAWALGHMLTAAGVAFLLYLFRDAVLAPLLAHMDLAVAAMLLGLGAVGLLWEFNVLHIHEHWHGWRKHRHLHTHLGRHREHGAMFSIGLVHGMASNDELLVLLVVALSITSLGGILVSVAAFSLGVVVGMILFGLGLSYPLLRWGEGRVRRAVNVGAAVLSIGYALLLIAGLGGVNLLPLPL